MTARLSSTATSTAFRALGPDPAWAGVLDALESEVGARELRELVEGSRFLRRERDVLPAAVVEDIARAWQRDGRLQMLCSAVEQNGDGLRLAVTPVPRDDLRTRAPHRRLEELLVSDANRSACDHVLANARGVSLLVGPEGSGKTHLLLAHAERVASRGRVLFVPADRLTLSLVRGVQQRELAEVRRLLRSADLLILDGLERLAGRAGSQNELEAALAHHSEQGSRVLLGSRQAPDAIGRLRPALRARLERLQTYALRPPTHQARVEIVRRRLERWRVHAVPEAASWLSSRLEGDLGSLDSLLTRVLAHRTARDGLIDLPRHHREMETAPAVQLRRPLPPGMILDLVCRHFNVRSADLLGAGRGPRVTRPRQIAMYLLRRRARLSYPEIGQRLHRHHTTALHACRRIDATRRSDAGLGAALELLDKELDRRAAESRD